MRTVTIRPAFTRRLLRVALNPREKSDRELLALFGSNRDEDAFAELVRRHGRLVLAVARRVTGCQQDAEDAFQAAFIVLARRATHIKQPEQLANWLYGVAYRTALEARAARRRMLVHPVSAIPEPAAPPIADDASDLRRVIDEELARLPEKYRAAVVLCDLEGLPRAEAATRLKIPEGTLSSRLAYARKVLANRLTRRGISTTAGGIALLLAGEATGGILPHELVNLTARAATRIASGGAVPPELVSPSVTHLTEGVMKIMFANRLRLSITAGILACGLIALGAVGIAQPQQFQQVMPPPTASQPNQNSYRQATPVDRLKVKAKGIEDEDVPYASMPMQAVVRVEEGKLIIRKRMMGKEAVMHQYGNQTVTSYESKSEILGTAINDASDIAVFDMKGNRLLPKVWKDKLKTDVHALIGFDGNLPNPRELALFKDDTLLLILPAGSHPAFGTPAPPTPPGGYPVTSYVPQTTYVPRTTYVPNTSLPAGTPIPPPPPTNDQLREDVVPAINTPTPTPSNQIPAQPPVPSSPSIAPPLPRSEVPFVPPSRQFDVPQATPKPQPALPTPSPGLPQNRSETTPAPQPVLPSTNTIPPRTEPLRDNSTEQPPAKEKPRTPPDRETM